MGCVDCMVLKVELIMNTPCFGLYSYRIHHTLIYQCLTLPERIFLDFERFDVDQYIPLPNCDGAHHATSRECPEFHTEKRALEIQVESRCTLPAAREQAWQTTSAEMAVNSYAQVLANSQADLVNHNLALSDESARLREVINTLRQDTASLKQRLNGYEQRLRTLEQTMVGGAHPDTSFVGVQNTTSVGSSHNITPVGEAHKPPVTKAHMASQTELAGTAGPRASMSPARMGRIEALGTPTHTSPISLQLCAGSWN